MDEKKIEMFNNIKARLQNCENNICYFDNLYLNLTDGSRMRCKCAEWTKDIGLVVTMIAPNGKVMKFFEYELDLIESPNAIWNAIHCKTKKDELLEEITHKLRVQPELRYTFNEMVEIQLFDGNKFGCLHLALDNDGNLDIKAWSAYTEVFYPTYNDLTEESLQELSDNIMPPRTLWVQAFYFTDEKSSDAFTIHQHDVPWSFTEEQMLDWLKENFPVFEWIHEAENQYVCYPDADCHNHYILATCDKE